MKLVGYLRGSDYKEQISTIEKYIEKNLKDLEINKFYLDIEGPGSRVSERQFYQKMIEQAGDWDALIVTSLEILHTDIRNMFDFLAFLLAYNKKLISVKEGVNDNTFLTGVYSLKEIYDTDSGNHVPRMVAQKARLNTWSGRPPYGYRIAEMGEKKTLAVNEAESLVVKLIFSERAGGVSYQAITNMLNQKGIPSTGRGWTHIKVMRILDNKVYWGFREIYNDIGEKMWVRHDYPTIIDDNVGRRVYQMRAIKRERKK